MSSKKQRLAAVLWVTILIALGAACKGRHDRVTGQDEQPETASTLLSAVRMNDPAAAAQLLKGFYPVENGAWRWTAGKFSVRLGVPPGAVQKGATLVFAFNLPAAVLQQLKTVNLSASIHGMALKSGEYKTAGPAMLTADIPASLLTGDSIEVDFALDRSLPPGADRRELGVVAVSAALNPR